MVEEVDEQPFPLKRHFQRRLVPVLIAFVVALVLTTAFASRSVIEDIYLELATKRAHGIAAGVAHEAPESWAKLMAGAELTKADLAPLSLAFAHEQAEFGLSRLKFYDLKRRTIYATEIGKIGSIENGQALRTVIEQRKPAVIAKDQPDGSRVYELYVPLFAAGELKSVVELYEPVTYLDHILYQAALPVVAIPGGLLVVLVVSLALLVGRAQNDINLRTETIIGLRKRLESLVSRGAVAAARKAESADHSQNLPSESIEATLLFSDVRDFTQFSEQHSPETVIGFLNQLMAQQVAIIQNHGGDVDKMIGDAVFARFEGPGREKGAVLAALEMQQALGLADFPRGVGIGIFSGRVIAGGIGLSDRLDYTVIGDSVNVAARLCSAAQAGEVVCDREALKIAAVAGFGDLETVQVKGRQSPLEVQRAKP